MSPEKRKRMWVAVKTILALAIVAYVARYFVNILGRVELGAISFAVRYELLAPAGLLYLLAHCCWATFWVRLLHGQGIHVSWYLGMRTYFVSQFGKYIPGKAWVVLMRVDMLRHHGGHPLPVAVTATYETLSSMAAGALLGVLMLPYLGVLPGVVSLPVVAFVAVAGVPVGLGFLNKLAARVAAKRRGPNARPLPAPSVFLLLQGLLHGACGHCLLGLSLGLTVLAVVPDATFTLESYPADLGAVSLSYVAGFVAIVVPGGFGAREGMLQVLITTRFVEGFGTEPAAALAVVVALVLRLVWTVAEVLLGLTLYFIPPTPPEHHTKHTESAQPG